MNTSASGLRPPEPDMIDRLDKTPIMHRIVKYRGVAYLGGVIADDLDCGMGDQTRQICEKLDLLLANAGSSKEEILSAQIFVTDLSQKKAMNDAWVEWLDGADLPARATVGVSNLGDPKILIEVVVTAAV